MKLVTEILYIETQAQKIPIILLITNPHNG